MVLVFITFLSSENSSPFCQFLDGCYCIFRMLLYLSDMFKILYKNFLIFFFKFFITNFSQGNTNNNSIYVFVVFFLAIALSQYKCYPLSKSLRVKDEAYLSRILICPRTGGVMTRISASIGFISKLVSMLKLPRLNDKIAK